ncbi:hypothetical protein O3P69_014454 [Scylla paramamosain]|uniref:Molybdenum cofactor sulfurase n=1 Tax=Scylla paramamosain TaxID=85552 RepID=A0AAW0TB78_SCYPA
MEQGSGFHILSSLKVPPSYNVEEIVVNEFSRMKDQCYLDHASTTLYSERQVQEVMKELSRSLLGNPHSRHTPSDTSTQNVEAVRHRILKYFNTTEEEYDLIFTSGATAALKLVAEHFDWNPGQQAALEDPTALTSSERDTTELRNKSQHCKRNKEEESSAGAFVYVQENHTSVLGIRGPAHKAGCDVYCLTTTEARDLLKEDVMNVTDAKEVSVSSCKDAGNSSEDSNVTECCKNHPKNSCSPRSSTTKTCSPSPQGQIKRRNCLFAYSAQCNFSGSKAPLQWIRRVQDGALHGLLSTPPMNRQAAGRSSTESRGCPQGPTWYVVLDAASLVATCPLDLTRWKPDFVSVSFYKIFGYPTGLGCLLVGRRAWGLLQKTYHGGGTVLMVDSRNIVTVPRPTLHERFEDGSLPFLSIPALRHGLDTIERLTGGIQNIEAHVYRLARYTHHTLRSMRHAGGTPVAHLFLAPGDTWQPDTHGSIVNFNLKNPDGSYVGYAQVERVASLYNIHLRTGCVCNPGACQVHLGITPEKLIGQFKAGHVCGDALDLVDGEPTGSVRVSFGYCSTYKDADQLLRMVQECFVEQPMTFDLTWMEGEVDLSWMRQEGGAGEIDKKEEGDSNDSGRRKGETDANEERKVELLDKGKVNITNNKSNNNGNNNNNSNSIKNNPPTQTHRNTTSSSVPSTRNITSSTQDSPHRLTDIVVYPVKSCGGVRVEAWWLGNAGLWLDHHWMVVTGGGATLTQKRLPSMALISPRFNLECGELVLSFEGEAEELSIPLNPTEPLDTTRASLCGGRVCGVQVQGLDCGEEAGDWLSRMLGMPDLRLMMQTNHRPGKLGKRGSGASGENLSLANESQYLVIHRPSVRSLLKEINSRGLEALTENELLERFRGNLVTDGGEAYEEDSWDTLTINGTTLQVQGCCRRCQMVCVVPGSGQRTREPMLSLSAARGSSMLFGVHASALPASAKEKRELCVGASVKVTVK